jgi:hypothetical protein
MKNFKRRTIAGNGIVKCLAIMICTLILFSGQVGAQSQITLKGIVIDSETNDPMPFATITILQSKTSVVSNESGEFLYHFPQSFENGVVQISYIGYKTVKLNASAIKPHAADDTI